MCDDDATTTKRWAPFSPPDEFDVVDAALPVSLVLATIWARGRAPGGRVEGVVGTLLIVELGSPGFLGKHDGCAVGRDNSAKKYGTPPNKVCLQTKSGSGNTMVMSELTGGVDGLGLLVFLMCSTYGRYRPRPTRRYGYGEGSFDAPLSHALITQIFEFWAIQRAPLTKN